MKDLLQFKLDQIGFRTLLWLLLFNCVIGCLMVEAKASEILRDPTAPLVSFSHSSIKPEFGEEEKKENTSLILQGVLIENGRKIAVINNQLVRIGEEIEGYIVTSIVDYSAQLSLEEETVLLSLVPENIKISDD